MSISRRSTRDLSHGYGQTRCSIGSSSWSHLSASPETLFGNSKSLCSSLLYRCSSDEIHLSSYRRTYMPESYHIAQELQKYNIPDYRPRQEQWVFTFAILFVEVVIDLSTGFGKLSRRYGLFSDCAETVASPSVKRRMLDGKIKLVSSGLTTHPSLMQNHPAIDAFVSWADYSLLDISLHSTACMIQ